MTASLAWTRKDRWFAVRQKCVPRCQQYRSTASATGTETKAQIWPSRSPVVDHVTYISLNPATCGSWRSTHELGRPQHVPYAYACHDPAACFTWTISGCGAKVQLHWGECPRVPVRQRCSCQDQNPGTWVAGIDIDVIAGIALS